MESQVDPALLKAALEKKGRFSDDIEFAPFVPENALAIEGILDAPEGVTLERRQTSVGRGWEGVAEAVVIGATAVVTTIQLAEYVARAWKWLRRKAREQEGSIAFSLGAAKYLCLADLARRLGGDIEGVELLWSGDIGHGPRNDVTHSGVDVFCLFFVRSEATWVYVIDSTGGLLAFAQGGPLPRMVADYNYVDGLDLDSAPEAAPQLFPDEGDRGD